jgi:hypothetical protein
MAPHPARRGARFPSHQKRGNGARRIHDGITDSDQTALFRVKAGSSWASLNDLLLYKSPDRATARRKLAQPPAPDLNDRDEVRGRPACASGEAREHLASGDRRCNPNRRASAGSVKCARIRALRELGAAAPAARHPRGGVHAWRSNSALGGPCGVSCRPVRAKSEVRAHIAPGKLGAATQCARMAGAAARDSRRSAPQPEPNFTRGPRRCPMRLNAGSCSIVLTRTQLRHWRHLSDKNYCRKAEPGGSPAQGQRPRRSTDRPARERRQPHGRRHRTARVVRTRSSSTIPFYGWLGTEARISGALGVR